MTHSDCRKANLSSSAPKMGEASGVGEAVGSAVGVTVGSGIGVAVGSSVGVAVGSGVGVAVGVRRWGVRRFRRRCFRRLRRYGVSDGCWRRACRSAVGVGVSVGTVEVGASVGSALAWLSVPAYERGRRLTALT